MTLEEFEIYVNCDKHLACHGFLTDDEIIAELESMDSENDDEKNDENEDEEEEDETQIISRQDASKAMDVLRKFMIQQNLEIYPILNLEEKLFTNFIEKSRQTKITEHFNET